jgi:putative molybdopterin biosynthesis protein
MRTKRKIYLKKKTLLEARDIISSGFALTNILDNEEIEVSEATGRVLAEPVSAKISSPNFHAAAMDGLAVKSEITFGAGETTPKNLAIGREAFFVNTGHVLPPGTDAVIMIEDVHLSDGERAEIIAPAFPWQNVRKMGEDIVATELLFPQNHVITPYCIGALISGGIASIKVRQKPHALIIPTGSELIDYRSAKPSQMKPGQVLESNSYVLGPLVEASGGRFTRHPMVMDDVGGIEEAVQNAVQKHYQTVLIVGGSSAGSEDYARHVISNLGEVLIHGVTIMPGKPVIVGKISNKPVFGIPGYPVSAIVAFEQFVRPLLLSMLGLPDHSRAAVEVAPTRKIASKLGVEEFLRVKLGRVGDRVVATPLPRGAGCITSITEADGIIRIPNNIEGIKDDTHVTAELLRPLSAINDTIVVVGSHDNSLDVLADQIKARQSRFTLSSSHVGSMGGLMAIKKGVCHLAGSHLLDPENGTYNKTYIDKYLSNIPVKRVNLVMRDQGIIVPDKNPKNIESIRDLARKDVSFINRQAGSGTRILLDYQIKRLGINPADIDGYDNEEFTHMSIAAAVLSRTADAGLGIFAAANALGLDFIPVVTEQYDLIIPEMYFNTEMIQILLECINSSEFKERVRNLGGYNTDKTGELIPS